VVNRHRKLHQTLVTKFLNSIVQSSGKGYRTRLVIPVASHPSFFNGWIVTGAVADGETRRRYHPFVLSWRPNPSPTFASRSRVHRVTTHLLRKDTLCARHTSETLFHFFPIYITHPYVVETSIHHSSIGREIPNVVSSSSLSSCCRCCCC